MILQALYQLALREGLAEDLDFEWQKVPWLVRLDREGHVLGIESTHSTPAESGKGRRKPRPEPKRFLLPREPKRAYGDRALLLCDKSDYVLGLPGQGDAPAAERERAARRAALFRDRVEECWTGCGDEGVAAVRRFLDRQRSGAEPVTLPEDYGPSDLIGFVLADDVDRLVTDRPAVRDWWHGQRAAQEGDGEPRTCLVTGRRITGTSLFPAIKRVPGASTSGAPLVSFNSPAFTSFGWGGNGNAPIAQDVAEACGTALARLLDPAFPDPRNPDRTLPVRSLRLSEDTVVCFWAAEESGEELAGAFLGLLSNPADPDAVAQQYRSIWHGRARELDDPSAFYALVLSGAQGRIIVRDWIESSVADTSRHLAAHFQDLSLPGWADGRGEGNGPRPRGLRSLLESLAPEGKSDAIPAAAVAELVECALKGYPYPLSLLQRALLRARAEIGRCDSREPRNRIVARSRMDARASLVKAVLVRRRRAFPDLCSYQEVTEMMDPNLKNPGYLFGRMLAIIERLQQEALGDVNASVVDRFFGAASATPRAVFPRLLRNARHHVRKAREEGSRGGRAFWLDRLLDDVLAALPPQAGFPAHLGMEDQGLFLLGYHQMRKWLWLGAEERAAWAAANPQAPRAYLPASEN